MAEIRRDREAAFLIPTQIHAEISIRERSAEAAAENALARREQGRIERYFLLRNANQDRHATEITVAPATAPPWSGSKHAGRPALALSARPEVAPSRPLDRLITRRYRLEQINEACHRRTVSPGGFAQWCAGGRWHRKRSRHHRVKRLDNLLPRNWREQRAEAGPAPDRAPTPSFIGGKRSSVITVRISHHKRRPLVATNRDLCAGYRFDRRDRRMRFALSIEITIGEAGFRHSVSDTSLRD
jgi:hypothetical protein